jgi:DNA-binding MarR family transcriptional regulator/GNAT superfamily N-acetyltransferase
MDRGQIRQVRSFNRAVTQRIGALQDDYLARGRPLGEARLIFEAGSSSAVDVRTLRHKLGLDSGYLSRLLRSLQLQGLIELSARPDDARARIIKLTAKGRAEFEAYDALSDRLAETILSNLGTAQRARLATSMADVERLLRAASITVATEPSDSTDALWCLDQYYAELDGRFEGGFDQRLGNASTCEDFAPPHGLFVIAREDQAPVGCGALKALDDGVGEIKRVWVSSAVRGLGVASRIMDSLEEAAGAMGFTTLRLDTNKALTEAHAMYRNRGYVEIEPYNDNPFAHLWFERPL